MANTLYVFANDADAQKAGFTEEGTYYTSIGNAVKAAKDGETVLIAAGNYNEKISGPGAKNNITITGETDSEGNSLVSWTGGITLDTADKWDNIIISDINFFNEGGTGTILSIKSGSGWEIKNCSFDATDHEGGFGWNPIAFPSGGSTRGGYTISYCHFKGGSIATRLSNDPNLGYAMKVVKCDIEDTNFNMQSSGAYDVIFENNDIVINYDLGREGKDNAFLVIKSDADQVNVKVSGGTLTMYGDTVPTDDKGWSAFSLGDYSKDRPNRVGSLVVEGVTIQNKTSNSFVSNFSKAEDYTFSIDLSDNTFVDADGNVVTDAKKIADEYLNLKNGDVAVDYSNFKDADGNACDVEASMSHENDQTEIAYTDGGFAYTYTNGVLSSVVAKDEVLYLNGEEITADLEYKAIKTASGTSKITDAEVVAGGLHVGTFNADENISGSATLELSGVKVNITNNNQGAESSIWIGDAFDGDDYGDARKGDYTLILSNGTSIRSEATYNDSVGGVAIRKDGILQITGGSSFYSQSTPIRGKVTVSGEDSIFSVLNGNMYGNGASITVLDGGTFEVAHTCGDCAANSHSAGKTFIVGDAAGEYAGKIIAGTKTEKGGIVKIGVADTLKVNALGIVEVKNGGAIIGAEAVTMPNGVTYYSNLDINGGTVEVADGTVNVGKINNSGTVTMTGGTMEADTLANSGTVKVTGTSTLNIGKVTGNALQLEGGVLKDSEIGGQVNVYGTKNAITGSADKPTSIDKLYVGYSAATAVNTELAINGTISKIGNLIVGQSTSAENYDAKTKYTVNIGTADGEKTTVGSETSGGAFQVKANGSVILNNADYYFNYTSFGGSVTATNSLLQITNVDNFIIGGGSVVLNNSTWNSRPSEGNSGSSLKLGSAYNSVAEGDASLTLNNSSTLDAWHLNILNANGYTVKVDAAGGSKITATMVTVGEGATLSLTGGATVTAKGTQGVYGFQEGTVTVNGAITMDAASMITSDAITGTGTITIDAKGFSGIKKVIDITGTQEWADGQLVFKNLGNVKVAYDADGDVVLANVDTKTIYVNSDWADKDPETDGVQSYKLGDEVAEGKYYGINAFDKLKFENSLLVIPADTTNVVLAGGNSDSESYGTFRTKNNLTISTTGDDYAVVNGVINVGSNIVFAKDSKVKILGVERTFGANNVATPDGKVSSITINGDVWFANGSNRQALYLWGGNSTPGKLIINAGGKLVTDGGAVQNNGTIVVKGYMEIGSQGDAPKFNGVGQNDNNNTPSSPITQGHLVVDGENRVSDNDGKLVVKHLRLNFGGGDTGYTNSEYGDDFWDAAEGSTVTIKNGGIIETAAVIFRNGKNNTLTLNNGKLIFNDGSAYGVDYSNQKSLYFDNRGVINASNNSEIDFGTNKFTNYGSIAVAGSTFSADSVTNNGTFSVAGAVKLNIGTFTGDNKAAHRPDIMTAADGTIIKNGSSVAADGGIGRVRAAGNITIGETATDAVFMHKFDTRNSTGKTVTVNGTFTVGRDASGFIALVAGKDSHAITLTSKVGALVSVNGNVYLEDNDGIRGNFVIDKNVTVRLNDFMLNETKTETHLRFTNSDTIVKGKVENMGDMNDVIALSSASVTVTGKDAGIYSNDILSLGFYTVYFGSDVTWNKDYNQTAYKSTLTVNKGATVTVNDYTFINTDSVINLDNATFTANSDVRNYGGIINVSNASFTVDGNMDRSFMAGGTNYVNGSISISGNSIFKVSGEIEGIKTISISGKADVNINAVGTEKIFVANGTVLTGTLDADYSVVDVKGTITLTDYTTISGAFSGGATIKANATNDFTLYDGNNTLLLAAGDYTNDTFGSNAVKGATKNAEITVDATKLDGTSFTNAKVNFKNVEHSSYWYDILEAKIDFDNIKSINGCEVYAVGKSYFFNANGVIYQLEDNYGNGIRFKETTAFSGEQSNVNIEGNLAGATLTMKSGKTTVKVADGSKAVIDSIQKNPNGGVNNVSVGNGSSLTVETIERMGNLTVGKKESEMIINEAIIGTAAAETIKVGDTSSFNSKDINFAAGKATLSLGKKASAKIDGDFIVDGANNTINLGAGATMTVDDILNNCGDNIEADIDANGDDIYDVKYAAAVGTTIKLGKGAEFTADDIVSLAGVSVANGSVDKNGNVTAAKFTADEIYGTEKKNTISLGNYNNFESTDIDLFDGNDTFKTGTGSTATISGKITNVETIAVGSKATLNVSEIDGVSKLTTANGSYDKKTGETRWTVFNADKITTTAKNDTVAFGNYSDVNVTGNVSFGDGNDKLSFGNGSDVDITGNVLLGDGKDTVKIGSDATIDIAGHLQTAETISVGARSDVKIAGQLFGASKVTVASGSADDKTVFEVKYVSGTGDNANFAFGDYTSVHVSGHELYPGYYYGFDFSKGNDKLTIGNNSDLTADFRIDFANGDDTFKIGNDSIVNVTGAIKFGQGNDTMTIGKNSVVRFESITDVETINAAKGADIIASSINDVDGDIKLDNVKGSWKNATIHDVEGTLESGMISGSVYANEWDVYTFTNASSISLANGDNGSLEGVIVDLYKKNETSGELELVKELHPEVLGSFGSTFGGLDLDAQYFIEVKVVDADLDKTDETNNKYSFKVTLA